MRTLEIITFAVLLVLAAIGYLPAQQSKEPVYLESERSNIRVIDEDNIELLYYDNVLFRYKGAELLCDTAVWYENAQVLEFWGNVRYADSVSSLTSRYLRYNQEENSFMATQGCELLQIAERVRIKGDTVVFDRDVEELYVTGEPNVAIDYDDPVAMIEIFCDTVHYLASDRYGEAINNVRIVKGSMVATCSLCVFNPDSNWIYLYGEPFARQSRNELSGDSMTITLENKLLKEIEVAGDGNAVYRKEIVSADTVSVGADTADVKAERYPTAADSVQVIADTAYTESRIEAKNILFKLEDEVLRRIISAGNSYSWYIPAPEDTTAEGRNEASGDSITLFFDNGELDRVRIDNSAVGEFFSNRMTDSLGSEYFADTVRYQAGQLDYAVSQKIINLVRDSEVQHGSIELFADTIRYNTVSKDLRAYPGRKAVPDTARPGEIDTIMVPILLKDGTQEMTGNRLVYNLETRRGKIRQSDTKLDQAYYHGGIVRKVGDDILLVEEGRYIPCEFKDANFHFWSKNMKLISGNKVIARPVVLYIERIPVFGAPFFVFSIKKGRHSGFLPFRIGTWSNGDRSVENFGYYWAVSDYFDLETRLRIHENTGVRFDGVLNYAKRYVLNGNVNFAYNRVTTSTFQGRNISDSWLISGSHSHKLSPSMSLNGSGSYQTSRNIVTDYTTDLRDRLNSQELRSQLNFSKRWERESFSAYVQHTKNFETENVSVTAPNLSFRVNSRPLFTPPEDPEAEKRWYHNIRLSYNADATNSYSKTKVGEEFSRKKFVRAVHRTSVNSPQNLFRYITVSPSASLTENWFVIRPTDRSEADSVRSDEFLRSWTSSLSLSARTDIYGYFFPPIPGLLGLRHTLTPSASFSLTPKSDLNEEEARYVGATVSNRQSRRMSFSLSQLFQMKYQSGENENKLDLFTLNTSTSYDFEADSRRLSNISSSIRTTSIPRLSLQVSAVHDPYNPVTGDLDLIGARLINLSVNTSFSLAGRTGYSAQPAAASAVGMPMAPARAGGAGGWNLSVGHSYSESRTLTSKSISHWITTSAAADLTRNWKIDYTQNYDIRRKVIVDRALHIIRDMRCWQAEFTWYPNGARSGYFFKIFLKQIPDVKLEKDASPLEDTFRGGQSYF